MGSARRTIAARARTAAVLATLAFGPSGTAPAEGPIARDWCLKGQRQLEAGDLAGAFESLRAAREALVAEKPLKEEVADFLALNLYNLGVRFNNMGEAPRALDCFVEDLRLIRLAPRLREAKFRESLVQGALSVASYLASTGQAARTLSAYDVIEQAAGGEPHVAAEVAAGRGRIALAGAGDDAGGIERAVGWMRKARELESSAATRSRDLAAALLRLSAARRRAGRIGDASEASAEAETLLREALAVDPVSPWPRIELAGLLLRARRYAEAASLLSEAETRLSSLLEKNPADPDAETVRRARSQCRENRAVALYNMAVDAANRAAFDEVERDLTEACPVSPALEETCRTLRKVVGDRRESLRRNVETHEKALAADPSSAADLLDLGDLYANLGDWDRALGYYRRLQSVAAATPGLADRIAGAADPGAPVERRRAIALSGAAVEMVFYRDGAGADLETAVRAAWLRVSAALGADSLEGPLRVTLYPNRRAFRERAGYRVGGLVKGNYSEGQLGFFESPSQTLVEWVSVLTHELTHHAVERLSGGAAPRWLSEGIARYVEGESAVVDRARLARRMREGDLVPLAQLDALMERSWNDVDHYLDMRDETLLAVEEIARRRAGAGRGTSLRELLTSLRDSPGDLPGILVRVSGSSLDQIDAAWRATLKRDVSGQAP